MEKDIAYYILPVLEDIKEIQNILDSNSASDFGLPETREQVESLFISMFSKVEKVSDQIEEELKKAEWPVIKRLRYLMVYDSEHLDWDLVYKTLTEQIPLVRTALKSVKY